MRSSAPLRSQRERLSAALFELLPRVGYPRLTVAALSARAGVSTASFYEFFAEKDDCLSAACAHAGASLLGDVPAPGDGDAALFLERLCARCAADPDQFELLFVHALAGGPSVHAERERVLAAFERDLQALLAACEPAFALPGAAVTGALAVLLGRRGRLGASASGASSARELLAWVGAFEGPEEDHLQRAAIALDPARDPLCREPSLPRGRHRLPATVVMGVLHERIVRAAARAFLHHGYTAATVKDIVAEARVARGVFYEVFANKHEVLLAAQGFAEPELAGICARAYFAPSRWPARMWSLLCALDELIGAEPALAYARLVAPYAGGAQATERAQQLPRLLEVAFYEGLAHSSGRVRPRPVFVTATAGAVFALVQRALLAGHRPDLGLLAYVALAPFCGVGEARRLVAELSVAPRPTLLDLAR